MAALAWFMRLQKQLQAWNLGRGPSAIAHASYVQASDFQVSDVQVSDFHVSDYRVSDV